MSTTTAAIGNTNMNPNTTDSSSISKIKNLIEKKDWRIWAAVLITVPALIGMGAWYYHTSTKKPKMGKKKKQMDKNKSKVLSKTTTTTATTTTSTTQPNNDATTSISKDTNKKGMVLKNKTLEIAHLDMEIVMYSFSVVLSSLPLFFYLFILTLDLI